MEQEIDLNSLDLNENTDMTRPLDIPIKAAASGKSNYTVTWPLSQTIGMNVARKSGTLQEIFQKLVMCDYTPRDPKQLPLAKWASYKKLISLFEPHAPIEVSRSGPGSLKKLITAWFKDHPAFASLEVKKWCRKLTDNDPQALPRSQVYKFSFEYTPGGQPLPTPLPDEVSNRKRGRQLPGY